MNYFIYFYFIIIYIILNVIYLFIWISWISILIKVKNIFIKLYIKQNCIIYNNIWIMNNKIFYYWFLISYFHLIFEINKNYTTKEIVISLATKVHLIENIIDAKLAD